MLWVSSFQLQWTGFKQPCSKTKPLSNISIPLLFQFEWNPKIMNEPLHRGTSFMCTEYDKPACFRTKPKSLHGIYHVFCSFTLAILLLNILSYNDTTYRFNTDTVKNTLIYVYVYIKWHVIWINFQRQQNTTRYNEETIDKMYLHNDSWTHGSYFKYTVAWGSG